MRHEREEGLSGVRNHGRTEEVRSFQIPLSRVNTISFAKMFSLGLKKSGDKRIIRRSHKICKKRGYPKITRAAHCAWHFRNRGTRSGKSDENSLGEFGTLLASEKKEAVIFLLL